MHFIGINIDNEKLTELAEKWIEKNYGEDCWDEGEGGYGVFDYPIVIDMHAEFKDFDCGDVKRSEPLFETFLQAVFEYECIIFDAGANEITEADFNSSYLAKKDWSYSVVEISE